MAENAGKRPLSKKTENCCEMTAGRVFCYREEKMILMIEPERHYKKIRKEEANHG